jgi:hypothetical protein
MGKQELKSEAPDPLNIGFVAVCDSEKIVEIGRQGPGAIT